MLLVKTGLAAAGALLLLWYWLADDVSWLRRGRRLRDALLIVIGIVSCAAWWNLGRFHYGPSFLIHYREFYHYYIGAKYAPELGYTRLYECTVVAEDEFANLGPRLAQITIRDLKTNTVVSAASVLAHLQDCKEHFSTERWQAFMRDSDFFWRGVSWDLWPDVLSDHGYNATPVWGLLGGIVANHVSELDEASAFRLALIDPILLLVMMLAIWWAFGWRTLCVALLFFGTNYPARYWWTGGAYLRTDWLLATIASICLMKREQPFAAGLAITYATLSRIFPGFIIAAIVLKIAIASIRARRLAWTSAQRRFLAGTVVAAALLVPAATIYGGGTESWRGFVANSEKHLATPLANNMGWRTIVAFSPSTRVEVDRDGQASEPFAVWKQHQLDNFQARRLIFLSGLLAYLVLLGAAVVRHADWVALALGAGLILFAAQLTCYYFVFFIAFALMWPYLRWSGFAMALVSLAGCLLAIALPDWTDDRYFAISAAYIAFVLALTTAFARSGGHTFAVNQRKKGDGGN